MEIELPRTQKRVSTEYRGAAVNKLEALFLFFSEFKRNLSARGGAHTRLRPTLYEALSYVRAQIELCIYLPMVTPWGKVDTDQQTVRMYVWSEASAKFSVFSSFLFVCLCVSIFDF